MSQEDLEYMLNYWHGWWRFHWHWSKETSHWGTFHGVCELDGNKYLSLNAGRFTVIFSCETLNEIRTRYRKMFA